MTYHVGAALEWEQAGQFDAIYMLDIIHHLPVEMVPSFLEQLYVLLKPLVCQMSAEPKDAQHQMLRRVLGLRSRPISSREVVPNWDG